MRPIVTIDTDLSSIILTDREHDFLKYCGQDLTLRQIAVKMGKSCRTIDGYRDSMFKKLNVRSTRGIVLWCFKYGFLKKKDIVLCPYKKKKGRLAAFLWRFFSEKIF